MVLVSSVEKRKRRQPTDDAADTDDAVECDDKRLVPVVVERWCSPILFSIVVQHQPVCVIHFHSHRHASHQDNNVEMDLQMNDETSSSK